MNVAWAVRARHESCLQALLDMPLSAAISSPRPIATCAVVSCAGLEQQQQQQQQASQLQLLLCHIPNITHWHIMHLSCN
jgi:hypothetical protein